MNIDPSYRHSRHTKPDPVAALMRRRANDRAHAERVRRADERPAGLNGQPISPPHLDRGRDMRDAGAGDLFW